MVRFVYLIKNLKVEIGVGWNLRPLLLGQNPGFFDGFPDSVTDKR